MQRTDGRVIFSRDAEDEFLAGIIHIHKAFEIREKVFVPAVQRLEQGDRRRVSGQGRRRGGAAADKKYSRTNQKIKKQRGTTAEQTEVTKKNQQKVPLKSLV